MIRKETAINVRKINVKIVPLIRSSTNTRIWKRFSLCRVRNYGGQGRTGRLCISKTMANASSPCQCPCCMDHWETPPQKWLHLHSPTMLLSNRYVFISASGVILFRAYNGKIFHDDTYGIFRHVYLYCEINYAIHCVMLYSVTYQLKCSSIIKF